MALIIADRIMESSVTTGTGNFALGGAYTGYRDFDSVMANADTCYYTIEAIDANGNPSGAWECGLGTFNDTDTLVRTTPSASSNGGAAVNFAAGTKRVMLNPTATHIATFKTGTCIGRQVITATGAGTYTPTAGTNSIIVEVQGGGGGGGGVAQPGASSVGAGRGGGGGGFATKRYTASFSGASYVVGAKGAGGAAGNNNGVAGSDTTFTVSATALTGSGGPGGLGTAGSSTTPNVGGITLGGAATNGDTNIPGGSSLGSHTLSTTIVSAGRGGGSQLSRGAAGVIQASANNSTAGNNADGYGGGGGGAVATGTGVARAGGDGSDGMIVILEFA